MFMSAFHFQHWAGVALVVPGLACLWSGVRMSRLLAKSWSGALDGWLPEYRRILKWSSAILATGALMTIAGIALLSKY
jgi:hypothetical protein